jgi:predicted transcriptional regulator
LKKLKDELSPEDIEAIQRGLEDIQNGRYITLEEYVATL